MPYFFADSFAIIGILKGNENYRQIPAGDLLTTEFNICEVAFAVCRDYPDTAGGIISRVRTLVTIEATDDRDYCAAAAVRMTANRTGKK